MAVSLDSLRSRPGIVPLEEPREMPAQDFGRAPSVRFARQPFRTWLARILTFGGALAATAYACHQMMLIVSLSEITALQWAMVGLFTVTFGWIALAASGALAGVFFGGGRRRAADSAALTTRTALVMPVYNEDPSRTFAALQAMGRALLETAQTEESVGDHFEIFVLSDSTDPHIWLQETAGVDLLRESLGRDLQVWYRRRHTNGGKKAGNIHEFVSRWGGRYDFMVVLDADSILDPSALRTLVREMEADPRCGILQSLPRLYGGRTLFARMQQFAGTVYGPIVARGITAWQGEDGNYWGHNAILRVEAFAAAAGLPVLPGRKPFGGEILSHDFVEAALIRRAGWSVRMLPDLEGSWEESPPSLLDVAARDRRWAQGNLQHLAVIGAKGLRWPNRVHMAIGVMSYLASPLWLALIFVGLLVTAQAATAEFEYFTEEFSLFPRWPVFDSERMIALFVATMGVLLLPKVLGIARATCKSSLRGSLGIVPMLLGAITETTLSMFYAPIFMMIQSRQVWEILRGSDSGWSAQQREHRSVRWADLLRRHAGHTLTGVLMAVGLAYVSRPLLAWMAPTVIGLALAVPFSALSSSVFAARVTRQSGILTIPEEVLLPRVVALRNQFEEKLRAELGGLWLGQLIGDELARLRHYAAVLPPPRAPRGRPDLERASVELKLGDATHWMEALEWLSDRERLTLLTHKELFETLVKLHEVSRLESLYATQDPPRGDESLSSARENG